MAEVVLSLAARADLVDIRKYSKAQFGGDVTDAYYTGFDDAFDLLARHPLAGQSRPDLGKGIRCTVHRKHRIFYTVTSEIILIVRIIHHARNAGRLLKWSS